MNWLQVTRHPILISFGLGLGLILLAALLVVGDITWTLERCSRGAEAGQICYVGMVRDDLFQPWLPFSAPRDAMRLTSIQMQEARSPESGELGLRPYEGRLILVRGHASGEWLYSARLLRVFGP